MPHHIIRVPLPDYLELEANQSYNITNAYTGSELDKIIQLKRKLKMPREKKGISGQKDEPFFKSATLDQISRRPKVSPFSSKEKRMMRIYKEGITSDGVRFKGEYDVPASAVKDPQRLTGIVPMVEVSTNIHTKSQNLKRNSKINADYEKYEYKCEDRIIIPGTIPKNRRNDIVVNGHKVKIADNLFILLLQFIVNIKRNMNGWVYIDTNKDEGKYQKYSSLRTTLEGNLLDGDGQKFIENDGSMRYRISTHPDYITCDKKKLLKHPINSVRDLARKLP